MNNLKTGLLGIDVGSVSIDVVVIAGDLRPSFRAYRRHHGRPDVTLRQILIEIEKEYAIEAAAATGTGAERLSSLLGVSFVNEIIAHVKAAATFYPNVKTVIDIGGQDSKLIMLERKDGNVMLYDFGRANIALVKSVGEYWFWVIPPGIAIATMAMAFILMGFSLDEILNPRLRQRR